jgi:hypothetical protein
MAILSRLPESKIEIRVRPGGRQIPNSKVRVHLEQYPINLYRIRRP